MEFTRDTSKVLTAIYQAYLEQRKAGRSNEDAKSFAPRFHENIDALSDWSVSDISDSLDELEAAGFIKQNIIGGFKIQPALIVQMENRFKSGASEVAKYMLDLIAGVATSLTF